jgi:hypothetical protein
MQRLDVKATCLSIVPGDAVAGRGVVVNCESGDEIATLGYALLERFL